MSLTQCFGSNLYITIDNVIYNKKLGRMHVEIGMYADSTKSSHIAQKTYEFSGHQSYRRVTGFASIPPANPIEGETWIVQEGAEGDWLDRESLLAVWLDGGWKFWFFGKEEMFYYIPTKKYCVFDERNKKIISAPMNRIEDKEWWDSWFSSKIIFSDETNLYKQIYVCLKQFPGFENAVDC
jgi:hypothetical protein